MGSGIDWEEKWKYAGNSEGAWVGKAEDLLVASELLCLRGMPFSINDKDPGTLPIALAGLNEKTIPPEEIPNRAITLDNIGMMLRGMALECWFKGLWVGTGGKLIKEGKYRRIPGTSDHYLLPLADKVSENLPLNISSDERKLLNRLSLKIVMGRYPVSKDWQRTKPKEVGNTWILKEYRRFPEDEELFKDLLTKLTELHLRQRQSTESDRFL